jgi:HSP20 family molecular chaperone IbpA
MTRNNDQSVMKRDNMLPAVSTSGRHSVVIPPADIYETPDAYVLSLDMPGATKEAIRVTLENGVLGVKAAVEGRHDRNAVRLFNELRGTVYARVFRVAEDIDQKSVDAQYEDGVLSLKLFKKESAKPREIRIS